MKKPRVKQKAHNSKENQGTKAEKNWDPVLNWEDVWEAWHSWTKKKTKGNFKIFRNRVVKFVLSVFLHRAIGK